MMRARPLLFSAGFLITLAMVSSAHAQGILVPSAGPINSSMAGASVAAPVDFGGSYWNPAILSGLESQEFLLGAALNFPSIHLESGLKADSIGGIFPATNRYGEARSNSGVPPGVASGFSFRPDENGPLTLGLGVFGLVGGGVNFNGSYQVPILTPRQPPRYFGEGPIYSNVSLLAINPMASYQFTEKLSIGGGPVITSGTPVLSPAFFAPGPRSLGGYGLPTFPDATNARPSWGAGFQIGLLYEINKNWNFGFSYKSPIWQEKWYWNSANPNLSPRTIGIQASLPEILSWGIAYKGLPKTLIDVDLRYIDYANTSLFGTKIIDGGLGWQSVFAVALGAQYKATDKITLRAGYLYNTNPIKDLGTLFNVQAPGIIQNTFTMGASYDVNDNLTASVAWMHGFRNSIQSPILQIPGSSVRLDAQVDTLWMGVNVKYGGKKHQTSTASTSPYSTEPPSSPGTPYIPPPQAPGIPGYDTAPSIGDLDLPMLPDPNAASSPAPVTPAVAASPAPAANGTSPVTTPSG